MITIGAEYLIAVSLIKKLLNENKEIVPFAEILQLGEDLQNRLNEAGIDAVVVRHSFPETIRQFSGYFEMVELPGIPYAKYAKGVTAHALKMRFMGYMPLNVLEIMSAMMKG